MVKGVVGRTASVQVIEHEIYPMVAKVDTGAYLNAIWASNIHEENGRLHFTLFGPHSKYYTGARLSTDDYYRTEVENSFGQSEKRYVVKLNLVVQGSPVEVEHMRFSLCDRSMKRYPILIGRNFLRGRFVVDVMMVSEDENSKLDRKN